MTAPETRWTAETEDLIVRRGAKIGAARDILEALADVGLLLPPGGETREEWAHQYKGHGKVWTRALPVPTRAIAERDHKEWLQAFAGLAGAGSRILRRETHTGPWIEVPS